MKMKSVISGTSCLLLLVTGAFLLAGCHPKPKPTQTEVAVSKLADAETKVGEIVSDPARAAKVDASIKKLEALVEEDAKSLDAHNAAIHALILDYNSTDEAFSKAFASFDAERQARIQAVIQIAESIRADTTPEEWAKLNRSREAALKAITR